MRKVLVVLMMLAASMVCAQDEPTTDSVVRNKIEAGPNFVTIGVILSEAKALGVKIDDEITTLPAASVHLFSKRDLEQGTTHSLLLKVEGEAIKGTIFSTTTASDYLRTAFPAVWEFGTPAEKQAAIQDIIPKMRGYYRDLVVQRRTELARMLQMQFEKEYAEQMLLTLQGQ